MRSSLIAAAFMAAALAGCASVPKPAAPPLDTSLPPVPASCAQGLGRYDSLNLAPPVDGNVISLLNQQWETFGRQDVDYPPNAKEGEITHMGSDEAQMWRYVQSYHLAACNRISQAKIANPDVNKRIAWSAYFISWIMVNAGVPASAFQAASYHSEYLEFMYEAQQAHPTTAKFFLHEPKAYSPKVGDLVCAKRKWREDSDYVVPVRIGHFKEGDSFFPTHCDIVVSVDRQKGVLQAIGGNVQNSVSRSTFYIDPQGRLIMPKDENKAARPWFAVAENRYFGPTAVAALP